jgi:hypothetical protein
MKMNLRLFAAAFFYLGSTCLVWAQDLGPQIKNFKDGIFLGCHLDRGGLLLWVKSII